MRSREMSLARLLMIPSAWMSRRVVSTYSSLWNASRPQPTATAPNTARANVIQPRISNIGELPETTART
jgi:hypothetical protein